jgi:hypothetical protein
MRNDRLTRGNLFRSAAIVAGAAVTPALPRHAAAQMQPRKGGTLRYGLS